MRPLKVLIKDFIYCQEDNYIKDGLPKYPLYHDGLPEKIKGCHP